MMWSVTGSAANKLFISAEMALYLGGNELTFRGEKAYLTSVALDL
jgi:hypothetical protein